MDGTFVFFEDMVWYKIHSFSDLNVVVVGVKDGDRKGIPDPCSTYQERRFLHLFGTQLYLAVLW